MNSDIMYFKYKLITVLVSAQTNNNQTGIRIYS